MKAVIMEVKNGYAAVMTEDGQFKKIKDKNYIAGMELNLNDTISPMVKKASALALSTAAALLLVFGIRDFYTPYSTISMDVNPSMVMSANRYDLVINIDAANDDAQEIVDELTDENLLYKPVETFLEAAMTQISEGDYQADDGTTYVMMSANSKDTDHSEELCEQLLEIGNQYTDITAIAVTADDETLKRAEEAGTTAGKLYLIDRLKEEDNSEDFDEDQWINKPVKDIVQEIDKLKTDSEEKAKEKPETKTNSGSDSSSDLDKKEPQIPADSNKKAQPDTENKENNTSTPPEKPAEGNGNSSGQNGTDSTPVAPAEGGESQGNTETPPEKPADDEPSMPDTLPEGNGANQPAPDSNAESVPNERPVPAK